MRTTILLPTTLMAVIAGTLTAQQDPKMSTRFAIGATTQYFFRGIMQQNGGIILQPELEISRQGLDIAGRPASWRVGSWNSVHEGGDAWYESQFSLGVDVEVITDITASVAYTAYTSPSNRFRFGSGATNSSNTQELIFRADLDDQARFENSSFLGFQPHFELAFELTGGRDAGGSRGTFLGLGVTPTFAPTDDLTISTPFRVGLSLANYYEGPRSGDDDLFGFVSLGGEARMPLCNQNSFFGPWEMIANVGLMVLGSNTRSMNDGDTVEVIAGVNFEMSW